MPAALLNRPIASMPSPDNWLSWEFWAKTTEGLNHLALIVGGTIGIVLLAIRTFAANRSANASLEQAKAANRSANASLEQAKAANQSATAALEQAKTAVVQAETAAKRHAEQTTADRERRITESFAKAVEQLGIDKLETRLGGIYTLERIAGESEREYWPIMETLTAFVRERAPWLPRSNAGDETARESTLAEHPVRPPTEIQAVLTVLGRRDKTAPEQFRNERAARRRLDLAETDLRGADLKDAHLEGADLKDAHLEGADLRGAYLDGADLRGAYLDGADLSSAHLAANLRGASLQKANLGSANLIGADLRGAHLEGAGFGVAHLEDANLRGAHLNDTFFGGERVVDFEGTFEGRRGMVGRRWESLTGAYLEGADLRDAVGLTEEQLVNASGDAETKVADELRPAHWPAATPDEPEWPATPDEPDNPK